MEKEKIVEMYEKIKKDVSCDDFLEITQGVFDKMVEYAIDHNDLEGMWRLVYSCHLDEIYMCANKVSDYLVLKRDVYYVCELFSILEIDSDVEYLVNKIVETHDREFVKAILDEPIGISCFLTQDQFNKLKSVL